MLYLAASLRFIAKLLWWIAAFDPTRTEPLRWGEVLANVDEQANLGDPDAIEMIVTDPGYFGRTERLAQWAMATFRCESGLDPWAVGAGRYHNIAQVDGGTLGDVRQGVTEALSIYDLQGPGAWPNCGRNAWR